MKARRVRSAFSAHDQPAQMRPWHDRLVLMLLSAWNIVAPEA
jgi:hypothetical protein